MRSRERSTMTCEVAAARSARGGFTLIELVISMTLVGIVLAIALPRFDRSRMRVNSQSLALRNTLMVAQRLAVTRGYDVVVNFDTAQGLVRVQEDPDGDLVSDAGERVTVTQLEGEVTMRRGSAPVLATGRVRGVNFNGRQNGMPTVVFHRDGSASEAGVFYLTTIRSLGGSHATDGHAFELARATGRVQAYRYDGSQWRREN